MSTLSIGKIVFLSHRAPPTPHFGDLVTTTRGKSGADLVTRSPKCALAGQTVVGVAVELVSRLFVRQNGAMPSVQIKDVPAEVHATLRRRAATAGQSLQEYLL